MNDDRAGEYRFASKVYQLTKPYEVREVIVERELSAGEVAIKPLLGSVCHADLRYFTGNRRPEMLARKLPMALIHEGIGVVLESRSSSFNPGDHVVIVPNIPGYADLGEETVEAYVSKGPSLEDNYSTNGRFLASGTDGLAQSVLIMPALCVIRIPDEVPREIAVLSELSTVSHQAVSKVEALMKDASIAIFGDGPVGYLTAALIHHLYHVGPDRLRVFGVVPEKLEQFDFASTSNITSYNFAESERFDIAIECAGGKFSSDAINQAIDVLKPGGQLILLGVSEDLVPINTRDILEKGITVFGSSRSSFRDYPPVIEAMKDPAYQQTLRKLLPSEFVAVRSAQDFYEAMKHTSENPQWKKVVLEFEW